MPKRTSSTSSSGCSTSTASGAAGSTTASPPRQPKASAAAAAIESALARRGALGPGDRDRGPKMRSLRRGDDLDIAIVGLHVFLGDCQAEPGSLDARLVLRTALLERLEDLVFLRIVDARAGILDVDYGVAVSLGQRQRNPPVGRRELDRVGEQIVQHYSKLILVAADMHRRELLLDGNALRRRGE